MLMFDSACAYVGKARQANLTQAKSLGCNVISAYIIGSPGGCSPQAKADVAAVRAMGMASSPNWERAADFFRNATIAQCQQAGAEALAAMTAIGYPKGSVCFFSWDYDILDRDYSAQIAKAKAVAKGLTSKYRFSAYAEMGLLKALKDAGVIPAGVKGWLTMSEGFGHFTDYDWKPYVAVVQQHNANKGWLNPTQPGTDINTILDPSALGAWWPDNSPYGDDMPSAQEVAAAVWAYPFKNVKANTSASAQHRLFDEVGGHAYNADHGVVALTAKVDALTEALISISKGNGVDIEAIKSQIDTQIKESLAGLHLEVETDAPAS